MNASSNSHPSTSPGESAEIRKASSGEIAADVESVREGWLERNWDRALFPIIGLITSGVIGFYSGLYSVQSKILDISQKVYKNESDISYVRPRADAIPDLKVEIESLKRSLEDLESQNAISLQTRDLIAHKESLVRQYTIEHIKDLVAEINSNN